MVQLITTAAASQGAYDRVTAALADYGSRRSGHDWQCPGHGDRNPSLTVRQGDKGALLHCHAGCDTEVVVKTLGLTVADLFDEPFESGGSQRRREFLASLADAGERAQAYPWHHRGGRTDRDIFLLAVLPVMARTGQATIALSQRDAAEMAGCSNSTASVSLTRLVRLHVLREDPPRDRTRVFTLHPGLLQDRSFPYVGARDNPSVPTYRNDRLCNNLAPTEWGAAHGRAARAVYAALAGSPGMTVTGIAAVSGVSKSSVSRLLRLTLSPRYVRKTGKLWARGEADPLEYNPETDSFAGPIVANRKARFARDREEQRKYKAGREKGTKAACISCGTVLAGASCPDCQPRPGSLTVMNDDPWDIWLNPTPGNAAERERRWQEWYDSQPGEMPELIAA